MERPVISLVLLLSFITVITAQVTPKPNATDKLFTMAYQVLSIDTSFFTNNNALGGPGGGPFYFGIEESKGPTSGRVVRSLQAWVDSHTLRRFVVEFTDGTSLKAGIEAGTATEKFYLASGEKISSLKIWAGKYRTGRSGGFELTTNQGRSFSVHTPDRTGDPYEPELGSGILVGMFGRSGSDIDCLGFALLRRVEKAQLINVKYPNYQQFVVHTKPKNIKTVTYDNTQGRVAQMFTFSGSESVTTSSSWSITAGMETGVKKEVSAGIPMIVETKLTVHVTISVSSTYSRESSTTMEQSFSFPVTAPAGEYVQAIATLYEGDIDMEYTADMVYTLDSGRTFQYTAKGTYYGVSVSDVAVSAVPFTVPRSKL